MTTTQKAFNQIQLRIKEVNQASYYGLDYWTIKDIKKALQIKLEEISYIEYQEAKDLML